MKPFLIALATLALSLSAEAQEVESYEMDSTSYYNALYSPNDYAQAPIKGSQRKLNQTSRIHTSVNMGTGFGSFGNYQYIMPTTSLQATNKLQLQFGMGIMMTDLKLRNYMPESPTYENMRAVTNYYSAAASYQTSERCRIYGSVIYATDMGDRHPSPAYNSKDRYMATMGATFNITPSLSIGFEVRNSKNMGYYDSMNSPLGCW